MRVRSYALGLAVCSIATAPVAAQEVVPDSAQNLSFSVAGGLSRYGPHAMTGLDYSMNRWLAARAELLVGRNWTNWPAASRLTAASVAMVVSAPERIRVTPYLFGGYGLSASQGFRPELGPLGGGGLRFNLGRFSPYIEARGQHRVGVPISIGIRF